MGKSRPSLREFPARKSLPPFVTKRWCQKCPQGEKVGERPTACARVFDGAAAARSSSRFSAMRSLLCASRNNDLLRFEFLSSHLAGFRPAGSHCEKSGKSDDTCASARSGCAKQRSLLCPLSERRWRHPLLFAVLDLLVLLDQAKSTEKK